MEVTDVRYSDAIAVRRRYRCRGARSITMRCASTPVLIWIERSLVTLSSSFKRKLAT